MNNADSFITCALKSLIFVRPYVIIYSHGKDICFSGCRLTVNHNYMEDSKTMRNLRRIMSGSLATLMIVAALMTGAHAKSYDDIASGDRYAEQIEILSDIGVIKGTSDKEFSPDEKVTREQMAMLLFRLMIGKDSAGRINSTAFTDLYDDTYHGAISWANASGYILGTSATTFEPTEGITMQDAMTMLVRALGHDTAKMNAGYPWTYIDTAIKLGLDDGMEDVEYTSVLTRAEIAGLLYNAVTAEYLIPKTAANGSTFYESTTIVERVFGYEISESVIVATNSYALEGVDTVAKDGYITVHTGDGLITVKYEELELEGAADSHIGKSYKLVYKSDDKSGLVSVLGCTELGKSTAAEKIEVEKDYKYTLIEGVKYQVVEELSDALSTNANELLVYAYSGDGTLVQVMSNEELADLTGAFDAHLIFDGKESSVASRLIIKPFEFGMLEIEDGEINLAGGMEEDELTIINPDKAESGDYVLYYFNEGNASLELAAVLPVSEPMKVTRLTSTTATIGGTRYILGNAKLGIAAEDIHAELGVGETVSVVAYGDQILAVESSDATVKAPSKYLVAQSDTTPVFTDGKFGYVMEAIIDGKEETIMVSNRVVRPGEVYRYTVDSDGEYTLIPRTVSGGMIVSGDNKFVQSGDRNDEIAFAIDEASSSTITAGSSYHTISAGEADSLISTAGDSSSVKFVMDGRTVIVVKVGDTFVKVSGAYTSTITINDGASVTAIFDNEIGSVETLRYLYISDGSLGSVDAAASSVKVIRHVGKEYIDGTVYNLYIALDLSTGKIDTMMSRSAELSEGTNYLTDIDGLISTTEASVTSGIVSGYTSTTITVGGETYKLASGAKFTKLNSDETVTSIALKDVFMGSVEIIIEDGAVKSVILLGPASFSAGYADSKITVAAEDDLRSADSYEFTSLAVLNPETGRKVEVDSEGFTASLLETDTFSFEIDTVEALEAGEYTLTFKVNGVRFTAEFTVE